MYIKFSSFFLSLIFPDVYITYYDTNLKNLQRQKNNFEKIYKFYFKFKGLVISLMIYYPGVLFPSLDVLVLTGEPAKLPETTDAVTV